MTALRRQTVFAGLDQPQSWPATRRAPQPQRLERELDVLPGVGATLKRKLARLGLVTLRDLLEHRPRRYESAVDEVPIAALAGQDEVAIAGEVLNVSARRRGRLRIVTARISDGVHFTASGADYLARAVFSLVDARWKSTKQADVAHPIGWNLADGLFGALDARRLPK